MKRRQYHSITGYSPTDNFEEPTPRRSARLLALNAPPIRPFPVLVSSTEENASPMGVVVASPEKPYIVSLDPDCTRLILERVDAGCLCRLLQTHNKQFLTKLHACISVVEVMRFRRVYSLPFSSLMALIRHCSRFTSLREVCIDDRFRTTSINHVIHVTKLVSTLGSSLRRLSLDHVVIDLTSTTLLNVTSSLKNLRNLTSLGLCQIKFSGCTQFVSDQWVINLINLPPFLERLKVIPLLSNEYNKEVANNLPLTLQRLAVTSTILHGMKSNCWPPYLTQLVVSPDNAMSRDIGSGITIPSTVTHLTYKDYFSNTRGDLSKINNGFSLADPSTLRTLRLQTYRSQGYFPNQSLSAQLSKLTSLESLTIRWTPIDTPTTYDTSLFPRSLTYLDAEIRREQWQHLPTGLKIMNPSSPNTLSSPCVHYHAVSDAAYAAHLPRSLCSLLVRNGSVPIPMPQLEHVEFDRLSVTRDAFDENLVNVGKSLRSLNVSVRDGNFFWLHNDGDMPSPIFTSRFPYLSVLHVNGRAAWIDNLGPVEAWLNHLPRTIRDLSLTLPATPLNGNGINLVNVVLPPLIEKLQLSFHNCVITLPDKLPLPLHCHFGIYGKKFIKGDIQMREKDLRDYAKPFSQGHIDFSGA